MITLIDIIIFINSDLEHFFCIFFLSALASFDITLSSGRVINT